MSCVAGTTTTVLRHAELPASRSSSSMLVQPRLPMPTIAPLSCTSVLHRASSRSSSATKAMFV
ncbi:hypothetical protein CK203_070503 [Vitis vinifera]|uniref:Uncharacterized protein n=1 Tax=Vitis vinifera TaxID=29760 RepID=A0A438FAW8_VITVI|nr:hypothetical protein CK203_070503 [Vitis vinifera]